tara:strand:- start:48 stop:1097 length:1050 start_codon:yes stop_codon:yes gene_type:complete
MSRILRRPMFRGGPVDSYNTGIASGLGQPKRGLVDEPGGYSGELITRKARARIRGPRDFGITNVNPFFFPKTNIGTARKSKFIDTPLYEDFPEVSNEMPSGLTVSADPNFFPSSVTDTGGIEDLKTTASVEEGLPKSKVEDLTTETEVEKVDIKDDEPEVTMTDLEKALGLDKARQEYAADALAAASKAFFEGRGFEAISDAAAVKSKAPDIKRLAGLEEFKAEKAKELYKEKLDAQARLKQGTMGNLQKDIRFLRGLRGADRIAALGKLGYKAPSLSAAIKELKITGQAPDPATIESLAELYIGPDFMGTVDITEDLSNKEEGTYLASDGSALVIIDEKGKQPRLQKL